MMLNLDKDKKYLLACSYGPDSMALFDMLLKKGYKFSVAHVNYHLRDESDDEEFALRKYCKEKNVEIFVYNNDMIPQRNIEASCREIRYSFFHRIYSKHKFDALLVAHNQDDHIETYLLQKMRKNLVIHYGINDNSIAFGMKILRPLLSYTKASLRSYCDDNNIPYSIDKTNELPIFERNRIRLGVVSMMSTEEIERILSEIDTENAKLDNLIQKISVVGDSIEEINQLNDTEFAYYLNHQFRKFGWLKSITYRQSLEVRKIIDSEKPNISLSIYPGYSLVKEYNRLFIRADKEEAFPTLYIDQPCVIDTDYLFVNLTGDTSNRNIAESDYPLIIRSAGFKDVYKIKDYYVQVRRLYIDWKMPSALRKRWPVIVNKNGVIIYIPRYRPDFVPDKDTNFYVKECFTLK